MLCKHMELFLSSFRPWCTNVIEKKYFILYPTLDQVVLLWSLPSKFPGPEWNIP